MKLFDFLDLSDVYEVFKSGFEHLGESSPLPDLKYCFITTGNVVQIFDIRKITVSENEMGLAIDSTKEKENKIASLTVHFDEYDHPEFVQFVTGRYSFNQMAAINRLNAYFPSRNTFSENALENIIYHSPLSISDVLKISSELNLQEMNDPRVSRIIELANKGNKPECIINMLKDER